jgi:hypothetical protein
MATSVLQAIEETFVTALIATSGVASVKIVPAHQAFERFGPGEDDIRVVTLPDDYPGCVVSLNERESKVVEDGESPGGGWRKYRVPVWVSTYAKSDGTDANEAKYKCWEVVQAIQTKMIVTSISFTGITIWPPVADSMENLPTDPNTYGVMQVFTVDYQLHASA